MFKEEQKSVFKIWRGVKRGGGGVYGDGTDRHQFHDGDVRVFTCEQLGSAALTLSRASPWLQNTSSAIIPR